MKAILFSFLAALVLAGCKTEAENVQVSPNSSPNLFSDWLGKTPEEIDSKLDQVWRHYFEGDLESQRLFYEAGDDMAYVWDVNNDDVRSEGMSYGMMIAVQMDRQAAFDRIWKWAVTHMRHDSGPLEGYFSWHCTRDGKRLSDVAASDGEEWFATALFMAGNRWGNGVGIFNYTQQALDILHALPVREENPDYIPMFDEEAAMIRFVPMRKWDGVSDPSYHLPAFYELWAIWDSEQSALWRRAAATSREYFKKAAHPETGLMPDYSTFDGKPFVHKGHEDFRFDAFRVLSNVALDWAWWKADPWAIEQSNRILRFFTPYGDKLPNQFTLDGQPLSNESSLGLYAMAATAGLAADRELAEPYVERLWTLDPPDGPLRYYDGLLYFLSLLQASGRFQPFMSPQ